MTTDHERHDRPEGGEQTLALLLLAGFRDLVDETHRRLAEQGHGSARPAHGFALQAIGSGATNAELAGRLGVTKQAAAKTIASLEREGYVARTADTTDARRVRAGHHGVA